MTCTGSEGDREQGRPHWRPSWLKSSLELHMIPFFKCFWICKAYESLDRGIFIEALRGYWMGPNLAQLLPT